MSAQNEWFTNVLMAAGKEGHESDIGFDLNPFKAIKSVGKAIGGGVKSVGKVVTSSSRAIKKGLASVPVVGPGLSAVYSVGPMGVVDFSARIATGERIDHAAYNHLKEQVKAYQDIAPYAQMVVSVVPGVGQGLSGAIGAANALSKGRPISEAVIEGVRGAVPGGPVATAAFDVAVAGVQGKPISAVALNALPLPAVQKEAIIKAVSAARDIASGKRVDESIYNQGKSYLPEAARKALDIGIALAQGKKLQDIARNEIPGSLTKFSALGSVKINANPVMKAGLQTVAHDPDMAKGFSVGVGFMGHKINPTALSTIRSSLNGAARKGFDIAASAHVGQVAKPLSKKIPPPERFGYYVTQGLHGGKPSNNAEIIKTVVRKPPMKKGAMLATSSIKAKNSQKSLWQKIEKWIRDVV
jgi:hypothetical protein